MIIVYDSLTGQNKRMAEKLGYEFINIRDCLDYRKKLQNIFLLTRSFNFGEIPESTKLFLNHYSDEVKALAVSGNKNWGENFGAAGDKISKLFDIELVLKYEGSGFDEDVLKIRNWINNYKKE